MVVRRTPMLDLARTLGDMDRFLSEVRPTDGWDVPFRPAIDLYDTGDHLTLKAVMPGVTADALDVSIQERILHIGGTFGTHLAEDEARDATWYQNEIGNGRFSREVTLPVPVDADGVEATFEDGILTLTMPKAEQARVKRIEVNTPHALTTG